MWLALLSRQHCTNFSQALASQVPLNVFWEKQRQLKAFSIQNEIRQLRNRSGKIN